MELDDFRKGELEVCSLTKLKGQPVSQIPPKAETNYDNCSPQPSYVCTTWLCSLLICFILPAAAIRPHSTKDRRHHRIRSVCLLQVCNVCTLRGAIIMLAAKHTTHPAGCPENLCQGEHSGAGPSRRVS